MEGKWAPQIGKENMYQYNGKELDTDFGLNLYHYGFRLYDPAIGRFPSADPIVENFAHVSPYNYAENEPIRHIDLWGLQKAILDIRAKNNPQFNRAYEINRKTSGGKAFTKALKGQDKINVVYALLQGNSTDTRGFAKLINSFSDFKTIRSQQHNIYYATEDNWEEYESYFEEGQSILLIGIAVDDDCSDNCSTEELGDIAHTINHEEVAHGINTLEGNDKDFKEEHGVYNGQKTHHSPSKQDIRTKSKYKNTQARKQQKEIENL